MAAGGHIPVLVREVVAALAPRAGATYVDGTFGAGGYSREMLDAAPCKVVGIDRDPNAVARGQDLARAYPGRLSVVEGRFGDMVEILAKAGIDKVAGVTLDLGVSSMQIDDPARGFSFRADGPLDMRMSREGRSAADLVNELGEDELAEIIRELGEERHARRVARAIVEARKAKRIETTGELAALVGRVVPRSGGIDPATRSFQALRIAVNDELGEIERGLSAAETVLEAGGRLAVVSFHSLEDRAVKRFLAARARPAARPSRHEPESVDKGQAPSFALIAKRPIEPSAAEIAANPRARSAKLRAAKRTAAPVWVGERAA
jgi:16S rRNA (cytosine1402-N4)-methyltransferase